MYKENSDLKNTIKEKDDMLAIFEVESKQKVKEIGNELKYHRDLETD